MRNAVKRHHRISQIGTQIHAGDNYRRVVEFLRAGLLGPIGTARTFNVMNQAPDGVGHAPDTKCPEGLDWDLWCGPAAKRPFNPILATDAYYHSSWMAYSGGWTPGMAPHIIDLPIWALDLGYPTVTSSAGGRYVLKDDGDAYDHHEVLWQYPNLTLTWMSSLTNSYDFRMSSQDPERRLGIYFHGTNGTLYANYGMFRVFAEGKRMEGKAAPPPSLPPRPATRLEWLDCRQVTSAAELQRVLPCEGGRADCAQPALAEAGPFDPLRSGERNHRGRSRSRAVGGARVPGTVGVSAKVPGGLMRSSGAVASGCALRRASLLPATPHRGSTPPAVRHQRSQPSP